MSVRASRFALLAVLAAPVASFAGSDSAMTACLDAFLATETVKDRKVSVEKGADSVPRPLALSGMYKIEVVATERASGKQLARVVCHANSKGTIVALNGSPVPGISSVAATR